MYKITSEFNEVLAELNDGTFLDYEAPLSSLAKLLINFEKSLEFEEFFEAEPALTDMLSSPELFLTMIINGSTNVLDKLKTRYKNKEEFTSLINLLIEVDASQQNKAIELIDACEVLSSNKNIIECTSLVCQLEGLDGEKLARKVITIAPTLIEDCYKRYLTFLVKCKYTFEGSLKSPSSRLGVMQQQVSSLKSNYPLLVHSNIGWIRNAMAHKKWIYDVTSNVIKVSDNQGVEHLFSPEELVIEIVSPFNTASKLFFDACFYYKLFKTVGVLEKLKQGFK